MNFEYRSVVYEIIIIKIKAKIRIKLNLYSAIKLNDTQALDMILEVHALYSIKKAKYGHRKVKKNVYVVHHVALQ